MNQLDSARTRQRILTLLCGGQYTALELAELLGISASAVRVHLGGLRDEGLLEGERQVRGVGKPVQRYRLSRAGQGFLSRAYLPLVQELISVLEARLEGDDLERTFREVGRRLADRQLGSASGGASAEAAAQLIESLGGMVEMVPSRTGTTLVGRCCPVGAIAATHPAICGAVEEMLARCTGLPVRQHCERNGIPRCRFEIGAAGSDDERLRETGAGGPP